MLGICVPGLGTRGGHRTAAGSGIAQRGGKLVKKAAAADSDWVHPDAFGPRAQFLALKEAPLKSRKFTRLYLLTIGT